MKQKSPLKSLGLILLLFGIFMLICGVLILAFTASSIGIWIVFGSVICNILGIMLATSKPRQ